MVESNGANGAQAHAYQPSTLAVHADDKLNTHTDVAPAIHVSTTYRYDNTDLNPKSDEEVMRTRLYLRIQLKSCD